MSSLEIVTADAPPSERPPVVNENRVLIEKLEPGQALLIHREAHDKPPVQMQRLLLAHARRVEKKFPGRRHTTRVSETGAVVGIYRVE